MKLGFTILGSDTNNRISSLPEIRNTLSDCQLLKSIYKLNITLPFFKAPRQRKDLYDSIDGYRIVSEKVVAFCIEEGYDTVDFIPFKDSGYYWLKPRRIIKFDAKKRGVSYLNFRKDCGEYNEVIGGYPVCLIRNKPLEDDFFRTDIAFGGSPKRPIICIGLETGEKLKRAKFSGLTLELIKDNYKLIPPTHYSDEEMDAILDSVLQDYKKKKSK